jgi:hypothetical protein
MKDIFARIGLIAMLLLPLCGYAQEVKTGTVTVSVISDKNVGVDAATVVLFNVKDSTLVKTALTDDKGVASLESISFGNYFIRITAEGYAAGIAPSFSLTATQPQLTLPTVQLSKPSVKMEGVVVNAKKPYIQRMSDRLVVNVENSIVNAGSTAMEVLERSPGVTVDQNDAISLRGKAGVIILIDGKPSPLSGTALASYLRGLPSNAIERIDLITNPSAKYDASGNAGVIDIRMKKDKRLGTNGTVTAGYGQGIFPKANGGISLNHRTKKINAFGSYNYMYREALNHLLLDRNFYDNGVFAGRDLKDNDAWMPISSHALRAGLDYFVSDRTTVGVVVNSNFSRFKRITNNSSVVIDAQQAPLSTFNTYATNNDPSNNTVINGNFRHTFKKKGEITLDVDYGVFNNGSVSSTETRYYNVDGSAMQPDYLLHGDQTGKLTLKSAKADFVAPIEKGLRLEAGVKTSYVSSDNDVQFLDMSTGIPQNDVNKTNHFLYNETNNASYVNLGKEFKSFDFTVGLRGEQTIVGTNQVKGNIQWDTSYFQLFPSAFVNYKLKKDQTIGLSVSRRIDRPGYSQLNPFLFLIDVTTYATGNPGLQPQFTWSYELNYTLRNINLSLSYSRTDNPMTTFIGKFSDVFPNIPVGNNVTVQVPVNLIATDYYGLTLSAPFQVTRWWNTVNNITAYYNYFTGSLGGSALQQGAPSADIRTNNTFTLKKGWAAEMNANYSTPGRSGYMYSRSQWGLALGVQKDVLQKKGNIRFYMTDIFWTNLPRATITYEGRYVEYWHAYRESRVANLSFTYRFGSNKVPQAKRRATASEEERRRIGG